MTTTIVLLTEGKHESIDYATVLIFGTLVEAEDFCETANTGRQKYWKKAEIVRGGEQIELSRPDNEA